jgi:CheY-like chemotaxis protein
MADAERASAAAAEKAERDFRANLNHKLRTPLNAIIGFAELLSLQPNATRRDTDVQQILKAAREMLGIIEHELSDPGDRNYAITTGAATVPLLAGCDVLYVEDDDVNFTLVERILELRPGLQLLHAAYGRLGVEMAEVYQPKLILLDLNLPDMHGADVLQMLQRQASTANIPVVILSANATPSQIERLLTAGARNYLTKPFNLDPFLAVVDEFMAASKARAA